MIETIQSANKVIVPDLYQKIELCGRICYKSEDKISNNLPCTCDKNPCCVMCNGTGITTSAHKFVKMINENQHESVIEHANIIVILSANKVPVFWTHDNRLEFWALCNKLKMSYISLDDHSENIIISGNARRWKTAFNTDSRQSIVDCIQNKFNKKWPLLFSKIDAVNNMEEFQNSIQVYHADNCSIPLPEMHQYATFKLVCDRGVSHEIVRHRKASYSQESTRYCNYGKCPVNGHNNIAFIVPDANWYNNEFVNYKIWRSACEASERSYLELINAGVKPQLARSVLNNSLKTEIMMSTDIPMWKYILKLRTSPKAHPQMVELMTYVKNILQL